LQGVYSYREVADLFPKSMKFPVFGTLPYGNAPGDRPFSAQGGSDQWTIEDLRQ
jgi:hypothetical protein